MTTTTLELPTIEKPVEKGSGLHPSLYILTWIFFSNITILFNKWLLDSAGFPYPVILTCWHLVFATLATQLLARTTNLLDSRHALPLSRRLYLRTILPIGILYSGSLVFSNLVYVYLSVAFIQMLKSSSPVAVLFFSWVWGVANPTLAQLLTILVIVFGVGLASFGEIQFSWLGFFFQIAGTVFEAVRLVMIQVMLSAEGLRMDPLVGLYYYAPVCAVMNLFIAWASEGPSFKLEDAAHAGWGMLFLSAVVAFMLNVASVFLIGKTSGLVMTLSGILKNIMLVGISVVIWQTQIAGLQAIGYSIALAGLVYYSVEPEQLTRAYRATARLAKGVLPSSSSDESSTGISKKVVVGVVSVIAVVGVVGVTGILLWQGYLEGILDKIAI